MKLEFRLLGNIAVLADGKPLELGGRRQRSVLALLLLQRNRPVATDVVAERLWPDDQPVTATKTIQVYVSRIRHTLGSEAGRLASSQAGYLLAVADEELDAARFEDRVRRARAALAQGAHEAAASGFEAALAIWSGSALGDLASERFARFEARSLEELRLQAREELFELRIAGGLGREAIGELRHLLSEQPGRERLSHLLMRALYADGRQGEALETYQDTRRYLADELGLEPGPELHELERAILTQEAPRLRRTILAGALVDARNGKAEATGRRNRRVVTVLRADVVSTPDTVSLDPEILEGRERRALEVVQRAVERHGGTVDHGDAAGVTAVFGLSVAREDDASRAVRAAVELKREPAPSDRAEVSFRIGLATGEILANPTGPTHASITGIPIQEAARLAASAAPRQVLLSLATTRLVQNTATTETMELQDSEGPFLSAARLVELNDDDGTNRRAITPFVGRRPELDTLQDAFDRVVASGTPGLVSVIGAPGIGKSRLVAEAFVRFTSDARVLRSRCLPYGDGITYWPIRELVLAASGIVSGDGRGEALAKLEATVFNVHPGEVLQSRLASVVGLSDAQPPGEEIPWAVRRFLEALAATGPVVVLIDDLQWAETALVEIIEHVLDLGRGPILVVTVARPELEDIRPDLLARPSLLLIRLDSLDGADSAILLDHLAPELSPGAIRSRILAAAEGNPLFVEQLVAFASDDLGADGWTLDDRTVADLRIPPTIGTLLAARLDGLPEKERRLLERAAVVGRTFWAGAVADLLSEDDRVDLLRDLARLARRDLIRPERSDLRDDEAYRFRHLLIRDAAYASLPKRDRAELHERFAGWLERRWVATNPGEYDLILGYHLEQAYLYRVGLGESGDDVGVLADRALRLIAPAAHAALERGDPHAAAALLRRAVDLTAPGPARIERLIDLRSALRTIGESVASDAAEAEIMMWLEEHPDAGLHHRHRLTESLFFLTGTIEEDRDAYEYYERAGDRLGMIRALEVSSNTFANVGRITEALDGLDRASALALEIGRPDRAAGFYWKMAWQLPDGPVPVPEALKRCWRYLELAGDHREARAIIVLTIGQLEAYDGVRDRWRSHFEEAKAVFDDLGLVVLHRAAYYPMQLAMTELAVGDPSRVIDLMCSSCAALERLGHVGHLGTAAPLTGQLLLALGRLEDAERYAFWGRDIAIAGDLDAQSRWRVAISGVRSQQARHDEAIALARESVAILADSEFIYSLQLAHLALARALRAASEEPAARVAAADAKRYASAMRNQATLRMIDAFLEVDR